MDASKGSIEAKGEMDASKKWMGERDASKGWSHPEAAGASTPFNKSAGFDAPRFVEPLIDKPTKSLAVGAGSNLLKVLFDVIKPYEQLYREDDDLRSLITNVKRGLLSLEQKPVESNSARWADGSLHNDLQWAADDMGEVLASRFPWSLSAISKKVSRLKVGLAMSLQIKVPIIILDVEIEGQSKQEEFEAYLHRLSIAFTSGLKDFRLFAPRHVPVAVQQLDLDTAIAITRSMESKELFADVLAILEGGRDGRIEIKGPAFPDELVSLLACLEHSKTLSALPPPAESWGRYFLDSEHEASSGEVALRIMTAIGKCGSLGEINLNPLSERGKYRVRVEEVTRLLTGWLRHRSGCAYLYLRRLKLYWVEGFGSTQVCQALAAAVLSSHSSLEHLDVQGVGLSVEGLGHISAALLSGHSSLRVLFLDDNAMIGGATGAQHLLDILTRSYLRTLGLSGIGMDAEGAELLAQGVARTKTVEHLRIGYDRDKNPEQAAMLVPLLTVFMKTVLQSSITQLNLEVTGLTGGEDSVVEAKLAQVVAHLLEHNTTLRLLRVTSFFIRRGLWALAHNTSIHTLEVVHQHSQDEEELDPLLVSILQECKKVKVLQLVFEKPYGPSKFTKAFFQGLGNDLGIKRLVLDGWDGLDDHMFQDLIQSLSSNTGTNPKYISITGTSWEKQGNKGVRLEKALRHEGLMDSVCCTSTCLLPFPLAWPEEESEKWGQACFCCEASGAMAEAALPAALVELLDDLESPSPSLSALPPPAGSTSWGDYFLHGEDEELGESGRDVRLRIMTAIGNCRSLQTINLNPERARGMYNVRDVEAIALLEGLKRNRVLGSLQLPAFKGFGTPESCKALAAAVVRPSISRLEFLDMRGLELSVEGVGHISTALRDNSASLLRVLNLDDNDMIGNAAGARHIAGILTHSPALRELGLWGIGMNDAGAMVIADAVARSTTLDRLHIGYDRQKHPEQAAMLISLLTALTPDHVSSSAAAPANRSITQLWLEVTGLPGSKDSAVGLAEAVAAMLASNPTLELLRVSSFFVRRGLWALAHNTKITRLEVVHQHSQDEEELDPVLVSILQECKKVEVLQLVFEKPYGPSKFTRAFFQGLGDDLGIKRLVLDGWNGLDDNMFEDLIQSLSSNTNLEEISIKGTPWEKQGNKSTQRRAWKGMRLEEALSPALRVQREQVRSLIAELESDSPVLNELPSVELWGSYFDCGCGERSSILCWTCQGRPEWQWALRLRLLTAVGHCRTLRKIYLNPDRPRISWHADRSVKLYEARAFLTGLQDNSVLQELDFGGYGGFVETQDCLRALTGVISRSYRSLDFLGLQYVGLSAEGLGAIAAALRLNGSSILSGLDLCGNEVGNAVGAQHLADILSNTPTLQGVAISSDGMDTEGAVLIAESLAHTTTLTRLTIQHDDLYGPKDCLGPLLQALVWPDDFDSETPDNLDTATMASSASGTCSAGSHHAQDPPPAFNVSITTLVLECNYEGWPEEVDPQLQRVLEQVLRSNGALNELSVSKLLRHTRFRFGWSDTRLGKGKQSGGRPGN